MTDLILVRVNCPDKAVAEALAETCLAERLAACANIAGPVTSIYEWQGEIERAEEWVLLLKTQAALWHRAEAFIKAQHPHEVPAIISIPCVFANKAYEDWLTKTLMS